jgi:cobalt/nickel transport system permease protein
MMFTGVWAVHIADGVLGWPVVAACSAATALLALLASWRVREEEVPRIALLAAAFFVASSIHVRLGPTSVHLLLNGLVGVVLGWRAPLAILLGVALQALLIPHGGLTTIGVNSLVETLPALAAGALFPALVALSRRTWSRFALVAVSTWLMAVLFTFAAAALVTNPWRDLLRFSETAGVVLSLDDMGPAIRFMLSPITLSAVALVGLAAACVDLRRTNPPEFAVGVCVGALAVVGTTLLTGGVLIADGAERWGQFATAVFLAHLPLALLEGLLLGVLVTFLARVKPELLRLPTPELRAALVLLAVLLLPSVASAHNLEADCKIDRQGKRVTVESWYESGDAPKGARAKVVRPDGAVLTEGPLDAKGVFMFTYEVPEALRVEISAPGGHRATLRIKAADLGAEPPPVTESAPERSRGRDLLLGLTFVLALAAFLLSWRNSVRLARHQHPA